MSGHTPGPWETVSPDTMDEPEWKVWATDFEKFVATVRCGSGIDDEANACLIAAAPDLLEALKSLRDRLAELESPIINVCTIAAIHGSEWTSGDWVRELEDADKAIAKAEGK